VRQRGWGWNPTGRRRWAILLLLAGHGFWVFMGHGGAERWQHLLGALSAPSEMVSAKWMAWRQARWQRVRDLEKANDELRNLRVDAALLRLNAMRDAARLQEAEEAGRLLGLKKQLPLELKAARIIANVRKAPFGGMVIDQGRDLGLVPDQGVVCPEGVVGRIWSVAAHQSTLLPLDAYNASTAVMLGRSRATGVLQGVGPGRAEIRYIGNQEVVQVNEPVYTSGLDGVFPRGLLVGAVSAVHGGEVELRVEVALGAPLDRLDLVLILPPAPPLELQPPQAPPADAKPSGTLIRGSK
jgi:rod shape-determining protein MreC